MRQVNSVHAVLFDQRSPYDFFAYATAGDERNWQLPGSDLATGDKPEEIIASQVLATMGICAQDARLQPVVELPSADGQARRYIFSGRIACGLIAAPADLTVERFSIQTLPDCQQRYHILAAVAESLAAPAMQRLAQ
ncbi:MAG TPA: hypothetical protein VLF91_05720 [Candidatus Saccharimonadales bacterium]|nr:hypothetical protein [Candidatus Saccharimonadales bacterium]